MACNAHYIKKRICVCIYVYKQKAGMLVKYWYK